MVIIKANQALIGHGFVGWRFQDGQVIWDPRPAENPGRLRGAFLDDLALLPFRPDYVVEFFNRHLDRADIAFTLKAMSWDDRAFWEAAELAALWRRFVQGRERPRLLSARLKPTPGRDRPPTVGEAVYALLGRGSVPVPAEAPAGYCYLLQNVRLPGPDGGWVWALDPNPEGLPQPELGSPILGISDRLLFVNRRLDPRQAVQTLVVRRLAGLMSRPPEPLLPVPDEPAWVPAGEGKLVQVPAWVPSAPQVRRRAEPSGDGLRVVDEYATPAACVAWLLSGELEAPDRRRCPICGRWFDPGAGRKRGSYRNRVYCSDRCRVKAQRLGYRVRPQD